MVCRLGSDGLRVGQLHVATRQYKSGRKCGQKFFHVVLHAHKPAEHIWFVTCQNDGCLWRQIWKVRVRTEPYALAGLAV
jgi:hypothetical protein